MRNRKDRYAQRIYPQGRPGICFTLSVERINTYPLDRQEYRARITCRKLARAPIFDWPGGLFAPAQGSESVYEAWRTALEFMTLRDGDTDAEYFADYTPQQLVFRDVWAESVWLAAEGLTKQGSTQP